MICLRWVLVLSVLGIVVSMCVGVYGASPVRFVLTVLSVCNSDEPSVCCVCVVTSDWGLLLLYLFVTEVTNPYDWSVFICVCRRARI